MVDYHTRVNDTNNTDTHTHTHTHRLHTHLLTGATHTCYVQCDMWICNYELYRRVINLKGYYISIIIY